MREQMIAEYHEMLAADEGLNASFLAGLNAAMRARRLDYGGRALGIALRPHILTGALYGKLASVSETLAGAFEKIAAALVSQPARMALVGLSESEGRLALVEHGFASPAVTTRLDAFVYGDEIKFVEYNAENPSSLTDQEGLNGVLSEVRALRASLERYRLRQFDPTASLLQALLATYKEWGGTGAPHIAIVDWEDLPTANEFVLLRDYFEERGVPTIICTPDELEYEGGRLRRHDFPVDLVYKRVIIHELLARYDETHPLLRAYINQDVCVVNPFRCKLVHKKAAFELLTDAEYAEWFSAAEREVIRACVPWTRRVAERRTRYRDGTIDLLEYVRKHRADFVLKPNDDYGGHGIYFGRTASESEWEGMIETALAGDYVVQEIIRLHTEEFPVFDDRAWSLQPMYVDTNPFIFNCKAEGALVRLSDSPIVNVTSGGGETGFFVLEGRRGTP